MDDWRWWTVSKLGQGIGAGEIDPVELTEVFLTAIENHDLKDRIYARVTPDRARAEAKASSDRAKAGLRRGPLDGVPIKNLNETKAAQYRNKFLGFIFQSFNLINYKNAVENVALPLYYQRMPRKQRQEKALQYLERVGLKQWAHHLPNELSGGQKQRVAIARAMAAEPKVLLADELTGALDSKTSYEVMDLIQNINDEGNTILVVTHEEDIAQMCKRIVHLRDGVIEKDEKIQQVRASEYVQ